MSFNILVRKSLFPILKKHGFGVAEEIRNSFKFQSSVMVVNLAFYERDQSHFIEIGRKGEALYPLNDDAIKELFDFPLPIDHVTSEAFVQNVSILLKSKYGAELLKGNIDSFISFNLRKVEKFNTELTHNKILDMASKAWKNNDYLSFIKNIDQIDINELPRSYRLRYKIAKDKL